MILRRKAAHTVGLAATLLYAAPPRGLTAQCPDGSPPPCRAQPARVAPPPNSVAVLYFDNLSRDTSDAYLADGLTEELIARLGQIERLQVKSRNAVRRYRGAVDPDPAALGRGLGVAHLVSGSVRRSKDRLRVTVELVRAMTGLRVWGEQYDRADADALLIQEDVARAVATAVAGRLDPAERRTLAVHPTRNPVAYNHYLRGNFYVAQRRSAAVRRAIAEYELAVGLDSTFAAAAAAAATAYGIWAGRGWPDSTLTRDSLLARGLAWTRRALQTDPSNGAAWGERGRLLHVRDPRNLDSAIAYLDRAVMLDPHSAEMLQLRGTLRRLLGHDSAATADYRRALALEPGRPVTLEHLAGQAAVGRRYGEAHALLDSAVMVEPGYYRGYLLRAQVSLLLGDPASARRDAETGWRMEMGDPGGPGVLAQVLAATGDTVAARALLDSVLAAVPADSFANSWQLVAPALIVLGDHEGAIALMEMIPVSFRGRASHFAFWSRLPQLDPLRSDPRFQRLVEESRPR